MKYALIITPIILLIISFKGNAQTNQRGDVKLGAYYFDGWTGENLHLTKKLRDSFPERKPIWGWVTSTPEIMEKQIAAASSAGLSFFSFCWYFPNLKHAGHEKPLNHALSLFLRAKNRNRLQFNIMVANGGPEFSLGPDTWDKMCDQSILLMKSSNYLKANGNPLLSFYNYESLLAEFGSIEALRKAMDNLRERARTAGLGDITIAACVSPNVQKMATAHLCGFDVLTAYNFLTVAMKKGDLTTPIDSLIATEPSIWNKFLKSDLPVIPVTTLNFDSRPWSEMNDFYKTSGRYVGFSTESVYKSISSLRNWMALNKHYLTIEKLAIAYAWNENGEGAWLTPSKTFKPLTGVKKALQ